jgi:hypothetical protein
MEEIKSTAHGGHRKSKFSCFFPRQQLQFDIIYFIEIKKQRELMDRPPTHLRETHTHIILACLARHHPPGTGLGCLMMSWSCLSYSYAAKMIEGMESCNQNAAVGPAIPGELGSACGSVALWASWPRSRTVRSGC